MLSLLIIATLINNNVFETIVSSAYFYYEIIGAFVIGITGVLYIKNRHDLNISIPTPILLFLAIPVYYFLQNVFYYNSAINIPQYLIINALLLFSYFSIFRIYTISFHSVYKVIAGLAYFESLYCLFQFFGWLKSDTPSFDVTGTWINPNVTSIFLAMAWPAVLYVHLQIKNKKWFSAVPILLILIAIVLLKCRTAFIGIAISTTLILNYQFAFVKKVRQKFAGYKALLPLLLGLIFITFSAFYLSASKQASTSGRAFIWKISMDMIAQKPLLGWGYDKFAREYNHSQASYFKLDKGTKEEIENASFVRTAYNELLYNLVEGGIVAVIILLSFYASLLIKYKQNTNLQTLISYAAVTSFIVMSLFNFAFFAIPSMGLFMLYVAMLCSSVKKDISKKTKINPIKYKLLVALTLISLSIYFFFSVTTTAVASAQSRKAFLLSGMGETNEAISIFESLQNQLSNSNEYLKNYGNALFIQKNYASAIDKYKEAVNQAPDPDILLKLGFCYQQTKQFNKAIEVCTLAHHIVPNRVLPLFSQMSIYLYAKDTLNAIKMAKQVVSIVPKVVSGETNFYKQQANILLNKSSAQKQ